MKNIIAAALLFISCQSQATDRTCHEINGTKTIKTNLRCTELDKLNPGTYWYDKEATDKKAKEDGSVFLPDYTIMMRKKVEEEKRIKTAPKIPNIDPAQ